MKKTRPDGGGPRRDKTENASETTPNPSRSASPFKNYRAVAAAGIALLAETFPQCFAVFQARRKPLKVGIHLDINAKLGGALTPQEIGIALQVYTHNFAYLHCIREGAPRIDLDGEPAGAVTAEEVEGARKMLAKRVKPPKAPRPVPPRRKQGSGIADLKKAAMARRASVS